MLRANDLFWSVISFIETRLLAQGRMFVGFESRLSGVQLLLSVLIAGAAWKLVIARSDRFDLRAFLSYLFPRTIYRSRSCAVDLKIFLANALLSPARRLMFGLSVGSGATLVSSALERSFAQPVRADAGFWVIVPIAIAVFLISDFSTYVAHRLCHEVKPLWAFHRVHHSAEVMTPLTVMRKHPVSDLFGSLVRIIFLAPLWGVIIFFWKPSAGPLIVTILTIGNGMFATFAGNLRHSHVWISYGRVLERVFVSPAMHQIHHSTAEEHWNRNYGEIFALWDFLFGTICLSGRHKVLKFGLAGDLELHRNWREAMIEPFIYLWKNFQRERSNAAARASLSLTSHHRDDLQNGRGDYYAQTLV